MRLEIIFTHSIRLKSIVTMLPDNDRLNTVWFGACWEKEPQVSKLTDPKKKGNTGSARSVKNQRPTIGFESVLSLFEIPIVGERVRDSGVVWVVEGEVCRLGKVLGEGKWNRIVS